MKNHNLIFIFNKSLHLVLMYEKSREPLAPQLSGIVGHGAETGVSGHDVALCELHEQTGIEEGDLTFGLKWLVTCTYPDDIELSVYYGVLIKREPTSGIVCKGTLWYPVCRASDTANYRIAGDGNIQYFIHSARERCLKEAMDTACLVDKFNVTAKRKLK